MYKILISVEAEIDIFEAVDWYEKHRKGLGQEFSMRFEEILYFLETNPKLYPIVYKEVRSVSLKQFPYLIFFTIKESKNEVHIFAVIHTRRNPEYWQLRASPQADEFI